MTSEDFPRGEPAFSICNLRTFHHSLTQNPPVVPHHLHGQAQIPFLCFSNVPVPLPPFIQHTNPSSPYSSDKSHQATCDSSLSLGRLSPPLSGKLLLMHHCPPSPSPVVSFPCSPKLGKCLFPQTLLPLCSSVVLKRKSVLTSPGGLLKHRFLGPTPRICSSVGMRWSLRMCISNKCQGDADR